MGVVKMEEIMGIRFDNEIVCCTCLIDDELMWCTADEIITYDDTQSGEVIYFCDRCKGQL